MSCLKSTTAFTKMMIKWRLYVLTAKRVERNHRAALGNASNFCQKAGGSFLYSERRHHLFIFRSVLILKASPVHSHTKYLKRK